MRISDWSSDVCSSDLLQFVHVCSSSLRPHCRGCQAVETSASSSTSSIFLAQKNPGKPGQGTQRTPVEKVRPPSHPLGQRSEASRVGKECVSTCRSRRSPYH